MRIDDVRIGREYLLRVPTGLWSAPAVCFRVRVREILPGGRVRLEPQASNVPEYASARSLRDEPQDETAAEERDRLARRVSELLQEREEADHEARCEVECLAGERDRLRVVARHVIAMADDAYLSGHPEWAEIVRGARAALPGGAS